MVVSVDRFLAFSDAYFAIIATLMANHLVQLDEKTVDKIRSSGTSFTLGDAIENNLAGVGIFFVTFLLIAKVFDEHATEMTNIPRIRPATVTAHIIGFYPSVGFLPATTAFISLYFRDSIYSSVLFFVNLLVLDMARAWVHQSLVNHSDCGILVLSKGKMVVGHPSLKDFFDVGSIPLLGSVASKYIWLTTAVEATSLTICIVLAVLTGVKQPGQYWTIPIYIVLILFDGNIADYLCYRWIPQINQAANLLSTGIVPALNTEDDNRNRISEADIEDYENYSDNLQYTRQDAIPGEYYVQSAASSFGLDRLVAFADGVFGVVATLIILQIKPETGAHGQPVESFNTYLHRHFRELISAFAVLMLAASLWNMHATLVRTMRMSNDNVARPCYRVNMLILSVSGILPFSFSLVIDFPSDYLSALIIGIVLLVVSLGFLMFLIHVTYKFRKHQMKSNAVEAELLDKPLRQSASENEQQEREAICFKRRSNQVKIKLSLLILGAIILICLGLAGGEGDGKIHEWVTTSVLIILVLGLATELLAESILQCSRKVFGEEDEDIDLSLTGRT
eukprot:gb/GECG01003024.1/.p1 GENE.gb/GECG01003024.1/~~gb/GECG01003024.1/.p1  ORF type:complete len:564 (+),score=56.39 gb/GECG01003024.1/:1-1692(+)